MGMLVTCRVDRQMRMAVTFRQSIVSMAQRADVCKRQRSQQKDGDGGG